MFDQMSKDLIGQTLPVRRFLENEYMLCLPGRCFDRAPVDWRDGAQLQNFWPAACMVSAADSTALTIVP